MQRCRCSRLLVDYHLLPPTYQYYILLQAVSEYFMSHGQEIRAVGSFLLPLSG